MLKYTMQVLLNKYLLADKKINNKLMLHKSYFIIKRTGEFQRNIYGSFLFLSRKRTTIRLGLLHSYKNYTFLYNINLLNHVIYKKIIIL